MAYKFGQFRKEQYTYSNYVKQLDKNEYLLSSVQTKVENMGETFSDIAVKRAFSPADGSMLIRVAVVKFPRTTTVTVKLIKENASPLATTNTQTIASLTVPALTNAAEPLAHFDIMITPSDSYAQLVFAIDRDSRDFTETPRAWIPTQTFMIESFGTISNIIPTLDIENTGRLKQIGVQGRPGLEMCINGEMIRVGRSGIYEISHGVDITFIGFIPDEDDHFLMDYQY